MHDITLLNVARHVYLDRECSLIGVCFRIPYNNLWARRILHSVSHATTSLSENAHVTPLEIVSIFTSPILHIFEPSLPGERHRCPEAGFAKKAFGILVTIALRLTSVSDKTAAWRENTQRIPTDLSGSHRSGKNLVRPQNLNPDSALRPGAPACIQHICYLVSIWASNLSQT